MAISLHGDRAVDALNAALLGADSMVLYAGTAPTDAQTALNSNPVVATLPVNALSNATDDGSEAKAEITFTADGNTVGGVATFFRILDGTDVILQGSVGTSGENLNLNDTDIPVGATLSIQESPDKFKITMPELGS
tara:strand:+ start:158 stop:565 length:408 start_codon:yes stop_codon:yes gene_type:complete